MYLLDLIYTFMMDCAFINITSQRELKNLLLTIAYPSIFTYYDFCIVQLTRIEPNQNLQDKTLSNRNN